MKIIEHCTKTVYKWPLLKTVIQCETLHNNKITISSIQPCNKWNTLKFNRTKPNAMQILRESKRFLSFAGITSKTSVKIYGKSIPRWLLRAAVILTLLLGLAVQFNLSIKGYSGYFKYFPFFFFSWPKQPFIITWCFADWMLNNGVTPSSGKLEGWKAERPEILGWPIFMLEKENYLFL